MLKPKRKITRKEIEKDPFLEGVFSLKQHLENKKQQYLKIGGVVIALVLVAFFVNQNSVSNQNEADYGVGIGMVYLNKGDYQNAIMQFQQIVDEYSSTDAGYNATFYIGKIHFDRGNYDLSLPHFERFISGSNNDFILSSAYELLSAIYESNDKLDEAISYQKKSINKSISKLGSAFSKLRLAKLYILNKNDELAVKYMNEVLEAHDDNFEIKKEYDFLYGLMGGVS
jgi:tetratricopeptide (TPR) repeat protein